MPITIEQSVGEIAVEFSGSIPFFESKGIDYCCGGKHSLKDACLSKGLDPATVAAELGAKAADREKVPGTDWQKAPLAGLIDHILAKHHTYTREQTALVARLAEKVARVHGDRHPFLAELRDLVFAIGSELDDHLHKEEQVLFPMLRKLEAAGDQAPKNPVLTGPVRVMMSEHEAVGAQLARVRQLTGDLTPPDDACNSFRALYSGLADLEADLHLHIHLENNVLFARAGALGWAD